MSLLRDHAYVTRRLLRMIKGANACFQRVSSYPLSDKTSCSPLASSHPACSPRFHAYLLVPLPLLAELGLRRYALPLLNEYTQFPHTCQCTYRSAPSSSQPMQISPPTSWSSGCVRSTAPTGLSARERASAWISQIQSTSMAGSVTRYRRCSRGREFGASFMRESCCVLRLSLG
jgi:hypothetical protein